MKTNHFICILVFCVIAISCENDKKYKSFNPATASALEQLATDFLEEKAIDREKKDSEVEELVYNWGEEGDADSLEKMTEEKERAFNKKWNDELLRRLDQKPDFYEAKLVTSLLIDFADKKRNARKEFEKALLASGKDGDLEEIEAFDREWEGKFITLISDNPATLDYPGALIVDFCDIQECCTSHDGMLRFYSWTTTRGGAELNMARFCQLRTTDGSVHVPIVKKAWGNSAHPSIKDDTRHPLNEEMPWEWKSLVDAIQVVDAGKKTYYLVESDSTADLSLSFSSLEAMCIDGEELLDFPLFDDGKGGFVNKLTTVKDENCFIYDEKSKTLTMEKYEGKEEPDGEGGLDYKGAVEFVVDGKVFRIKQ